MTRFDFLVFALMALSAWLGWHRGGSREVVTVIAVGFGLLLLGTLGASLSALSEGITARLLVLLGLFSFGYIAALLAGGWAVRRWLGPEKKRGDRLAGGAFGLLRGWVMAAFVLLTISIFHTGTALPPTVENSLTRQGLEKTLEIFFDNAQPEHGDLSNGPTRAISPLTATTRA